MDAQIKELLDALPGEMSEEFAAEVERRSNRILTGEVTGTSGGGMVVATGSLKGGITKVTLDDSMFETKDSEMTSDMIVSALNDLNSNMAKYSEETARDMAKFITMEMLSNLHHETRKLDKDE